MKYAVGMASGTMICVPSFMKICSGIQKLIKGIHRHTDRQTRCVCFIKRDRLMQFRGIIAAHKINLWQNSELFNVEADAIYGDHFTSKRLISLSFIIVRVSVISRIIHLYVLHTSG
jgi:hypothetical protein